MYRRGHALFSKLNKKIKAFTECESFDIYFNLIPSILKHRTPKKASEAYEFF